jgi:hypothetical protein
MKSSGKTPSIPAHTAEKQFCMQQTETSCEPMTAGKANRAAEASTVASSGRPNEGELAAGSRCGGGN